MVRFFYEKLLVTNRSYGADWIRNVLQETCSSRRYVKEKALSQEKNNFTTATDICRPLTKSEWITSCEYNRRCSVRKGRALLTFLPVSTGPLKARCVSSPPHAAIYFRNSFCRFRLRSGRPGFDYSQGTIFFSATITRTDLGPTQNPVRWVSGFLPSVIRSERDADYSSPSAWSYSFTPSYACAAWYLVKLKDTFTFFIVIEAAEWQISYFYMWLH